jgi:hypothetical protein
VPVNTTAVAYSIDKRGEGEDVRIVSVQLRLDKAEVSVLKVLILASLQWEEMNTRLQMHKSPKQSAPTNKI